MITIDIAKNARNSFKSSDFSNWKSEFTDEDYQDMGRYLLLDDDPETPKESKLSLDWSAEFPRLLGLGINRNLIGWVKDIIINQLSGYDHIFNTSYLVDYSLRVITTCGITVYIPIREKDGAQ